MRCVHAECLASSACARITPPQALRRLAPRSGVNITTFSTLQYPSAATAWLRRHFTRSSDTGRSDVSISKQDGDLQSIGQMPQQSPQTALKGHVVHASPTHIIVMVNGLFGSAANWDVICEQLQKYLPPDTLLHPSRVNARFSTYQGIDVCGQRLAEEVRSAVASAGPSLRDISIVAHSMGGLLARYAIGALYNPSNSTLCGLTPCHFITMATPHCGCDADGVAQVPFIGWTGNIPLLGQQLYRFLAGISGSTASLIFQRTGQQFFLLDGAAAAATAAPQPSGASTAAAAASADSTAQLPLLLQLTQDCPDRGLYFYSALAAFKTRTCYANMDGDHLVNFANSSLRALDQLPPSPPTVTTAKGVVLEDRLSAAFWPTTWQQLQQQWCQAATGGAAQATLVDRHQEQQQQPLLAAVSAAAGQAYQPSRFWQQQQQQQQQAVRPAATLATAEPSSWHILDAGNSNGPARHTRPAQQPSAQAVAAVELEVCGAMSAATAVVAAGLESGRASPAIDAGADNADEVVDLQYNSPISAPLGQQAVTSTDDTQLEQGLQQLRLSSSNAATNAAIVASAEADLTSGLAQPLGQAAPAGSPDEAAAGVAADVVQLAAAGASSTPGGRAAVVSHMLRRLQELPWRRIDVSFSGARFGFAHNNIQVTRRWWNFEGFAVPQHLAQQLQLMHALVLGPQLQQQQQQQQLQDEPADPAEQQLRPMQGA